MAQQVGQGAEGIPTPVTLVRAFPRVQANVRHQPSLLREGWAAVGARVRLLPHVEPLVGLEVRGPAKALPTHRALNGPIPAVDHFVSDELGGLMEGLAAGPAFELPPLAVRSEVNSQVGQGNEGLVTVRAAVRVDGIPVV